jgi:5'(3')-deoxyribonucleotidase
MNCGRIGADEDYYIGGNMKKGTIALDFDDVLYDADVVSRALVEHGIDPDTVRSWEMKEVPPDIVKIIRERFHKPEYMCDPEGLIPESLVAVRRLARLGYRLIVVTCRAHEIADETRALIAKFCPDVSEVFVIGLGGNKVATLKAQEAILLIDDGPHNIEAVDEVGIPFVLISNRKTTYNHKLAKRLRRRVGTGLVAASLSVVVSWFQRRKPTITDYEVREQIWREYEHGSKHL